MGGRSRPEYSEMGAGTNLFPAISIPAFILLQNLLKQYFTEKGEATAPLAHPLNSLMWRAEVLEKSAFFLFYEVIIFVEILYSDPPYLPAP